MLSAYNDPTYVFTDLGQEQHQGITVEHIQVYRSISDKEQDFVTLVKRWSAVDYYLESQTAIPIAISFPTHPDRNAMSDIPVEVKYSDYRRIGGILILFPDKSIFQPISAAADSS